VLSPDRGGCQAARILDPARSTTRSRSPSRSTSAVASPSPAGWARLRCTQTGGRVLAVEMEARRPSRPGCARPVEVAVEVEVRHLDVVEGARLDRMRDPGRSLVPAAARPPRSRPRPASGRRRRRPPQAVEKLPPGAISWRRTPGSRTRPGRRRCLDEQSTSRRRPRRADCPTGRRARRRRRPGR